jgi:FkbM family methyltransferase
MNDSIKDFIKRLIKLSPIPLSKNHRYDLLTQKIIKTLNPNSNCIDVGCHKGEILDLFVASAPWGHHYAFEPLPSQFSKLKAKYGRLKNVSLFQSAVCDQTGTTTFNHVLTNPSYSGIKKRDYDKHGEKDTLITVDTSTLDETIGGDTKIDMIKIDVEGAELLVLNGAKELIEKNKPIIIFEFGAGASNHYGTTPELIFDFFDHRQMKIYTLQSFCRSKVALNKSQLNDHFTQNTEYYFVAHI